MSGVFLLLLPHLFNILISIGFFSKYDIYQTFIGSGNNYMIFLQLLVVFLIIALAKWSIKKQNLGFFFFLLMIAVLEIIFTSLGFTSSFIKRIALYFSFASIILLTNFTDIFSDKLGKFITYAAVILYGILYFYLSYYLFGQANIIPYHSIFGVKL
jgi:hypothetical protein